MNPLLHHGVAALLAAGVAAAAWRARALSGSGAVAAVGVGWAHVAGAGPVGAGALLAFFATSTILSRVGKAAKDRLGYEKGGTRDAAQVLANGGIAALAAALLLVWPGDARLSAAVLGALAAANADTWGTEIGSLWGRAPRRITDGKPARPGESGAVSAAGTLASAAGALLIGGVGLALGKGGVGLALAVGAAGLAGSLFDSLLGATVQEMRRCPRCGAVTERRTHCDIPTQPFRGVRWIGNDAVNLAATLLGALLGAILCGMV